MNAAAARAGTSALTLFGMLLAGTEGRAALFRTLGRIFGGFSDTAKAFLIIASARTHPSLKATASEHCGCSGWHPFLPGRRNCKGGIVVLTCTASMSEWTHVCSCIAWQFRLHQVC